MANQRSEISLGLIFGISAYVIWGLLPLYWQQLESAGSLEIVSHRAVWTLLMCVVILGFSKKLKSTFLHFKNRQTLLTLTAASALISINWITYIWAANNGHVVEASLGYYITPLIMITFGVLLLKEKLRPLQWIAVGLAFFGVLILTIDYGRLPWVAISLALSWGTYGVIKKKLGLGALEGLAIETLITFLPYTLYLIFLAHNGNGRFGSTITVTFLLICAGVVTAVPLLLFNGSARRLPYSLSGLLQYITPTLLFSIGVWVGHEKMPIARWFGFFLIWIALFTLGTDLIRSSRPVDNRITQ